MKQNNKTFREILTASAAHAREILEKRETDARESEQQKAALQNEIEKLKSHRVLAAETGNRVLYERLCKDIHEKEDSLQFFVIRGAGLSKASDPETAQKEMADLKAAFTEHEKAELTEILGALDELSEKISALDKAGWAAIDAGKEWARVAGAEMGPFGAPGYQVDRFQMGGMVRLISTDLLQRLRQYLA